MLTTKERIRALIGNLRNFDWSIFQQYRLEKEDAHALLELLEQPEIRKLYEVQKKMSPDNQIK